MGVQKQRVAGMLDKFNENKLLPAHHAAKRLRQKLLIVTDDKLGNCFLVSTEHAQNFHVG